ncbi:hypothetical protein RJ641_035519 [Dillenia turbinata]|uniref:Uncharacterized protein n=1 Tax=Dillenia turbinata TaxID=194707 RepID=A0AAN8VKI4_9MAGN
MECNHSSDIVNVSSYHGQLKAFHLLFQVKAEMENINSLTEGNLDKIMQCFLQDFKESKPQENGWPLTVSAYKVLKASINAYMIIIAQKFPSLCANNCVHPGMVKTDMQCNMGRLTAEEGARVPVVLALVLEGSPSDLFDEMEMTGWTPCRKFIHSEKAGTNMENMDTHKEENWTQLFNSSYRILKRTS